MATVTITVRCRSCRAWFELSDRRARDYRQQGQQPICHTCRHPRRTAPTDRHRQWWLERFTLDEIRELAEGIFGPGKGSS